MKDQKQKISGRWVPVTPIHQQELQQRQRDREIASFRLSGCAICRTEFYAPDIGRLLPTRLHSLLYRMPRVYGFVVETHSFLHRMVARYRRRYGVFGVSGLPLSEVGEDGVQVPNIRMRSCRDYIRNYAQVRPWATTLDLEIYRDAWQAGAEWAAHNACNPDTVISPKSPNLPCEGF